MKTSADVAIVGGGVIGLALARELSSRGADVLVIERGRTGTEASWAAAGLLSAQSDAVAPSAFFDLALESRDLYPGWTAALAGETGRDAGWRRTGVLRCGGEDLLARFAWQIEAGLPVERLDARGVATCSRGRAAAEIAFGLFFPEDAVVHSRQLVGRAPSLPRSPRRPDRGGRGGDPVSRREGSLSRGRDVFRDRGVRAGRRRRGRVGEPGPDAALRGYPSSRFAVRSSSSPTTPGSRRCSSRRRSTSFRVPTARLLVGATVERDRFREGSHGRRGRRRFSPSAIALAPSVANARVTGAWAGLRPGTPDGLPLLGESPVRSLILATGHFRNGILLAPLTALLIADVVEGARVAATSPRFRRSASRRPRSRSRDGGVSR